MPTKDFWNPTNILDEDHDLVLLFLDAIAQ